MIYRILTGTNRAFWDERDEDPIRFAMPLVGAGATLGGTMAELRLPAPDLENPRVRFWFTEAGWNRVGRAVVAEGRQRGYVIKVIRRKNPRRSQIVYRDELQLALLPQKEANRRR
ncbi:MAG: hypothetical protein U0031_10615 [Thermomicrobiales bacterium]